MRSFTSPLAPWTSLLFFRPSRPTPPSVALLSPNAFVGNAENMAALRHFHLSPPQVCKGLLVEVCDREIVVSAFRSGVRGLFCLSESSLRLVSQCIQRVGRRQSWAHTEHMGDPLQL